MDVNINVKHFIIFHDRFVAGTVRLLTLLACDPLTIIQPRIELETNLCLKTLTLS